MAEAVGEDRIPAFPSAHSCGFPPGATGSDVFSVIFRLSAARRGAFAGASLSARRSSLRAAGLRRLAGLFVAGSAHGIQPFAALLRPESSADVFRRGGPHVVCLPHPPRWFWSRYRPSKTVNSTRPIRMYQVRLLGIDPSDQPSSACRWTTGLCCLGLCLFRACGHPLAQRGGFVPTNTHRPSPVPFPAALRS